MIVGSWALFAFLLGAVPVGPMLARHFADVSLQERGSGNTGATNVARVVGRYAGLATLLADIAKGVVGAAGGLWATGSVGVAWGCGIAAVLGHCFTPYLRWRGGKGVAASFGVLLVTVPEVALWTIAVWGGIVGISRRSSAGSLAALPAVVALTAWYAGGQVVWAALLAAVVLLRHVDNIARLVSGTEHGLYQESSAPTMQGDAQNADSSMMT